MKPAGFGRENPSGGGPFGLGLRCRKRHSPLRGCSACSASPQTKIPCRSTPQNFKTGSWEMERTGGEPDVVGVKSGGFVFMDCAPESPAGRRSFCYDRQKPDVVNQTRSNPALRDWRGQFAPELPVLIPRIRGN